MPRNGSNVYSADWVNASPNTTIESAKVNAMVADFVVDANAARPVTAGGTGATTAIGGADNLSTQGTAIASATTTDIGAATGRYVHITGTTTITGLGTKTAGVVRALTFDGALTLTHNATSLILPGAANITTAAGDTAVFVSEGSGNWRCLAYQRAASAPLQFASAAQQESASSLTTVVAPGVQHSHPSAAKAWARVTEDGAGNYTLAAAYNIASIVDNGTGNVTVNFNTVFSSAAYACVVNSNSSGVIATVTSPAAGSVVVRIFDTVPTAVDRGFFLVAFGDQ